MLQRAHRYKALDINCVDSLGRGSLTLAIDGENLEMVELLVVMGVQTRDALLHSINVEFVEAVELLLEHEELIHKDGEPYVSTLFPTTVHIICLLFNSIFYLFYLILELADRRHEYCSIHPRHHTLNFGRPSE